MMFSQYCRIESAAGGVFCTEREFIREAHKLLSKTGKSHDQREARHAWLRDGLKMRLDARQEYRDVMSGNLYSHV